LITRVAYRSQDLEVVDRLQEIRFSLTVVTDDDRAIRRQLEVYAFKIPEIANVDVVEADARFCSVPRFSRSGCSGGGLNDRHFPLNEGGRFSMKARIPSRMSSVAASRPK